MPAFGGLICFLLDVRVLALWGFVEFVCLYTSLNVHYSLSDYRIGFCDVCVFILYEYGLKWFGNSVFMSDGQRIVTIHW